MSNIGNAVSQSPERLKFRYHYLHFQNFLLKGVCFSTIENSSNDKGHFKIFSLMIWIAKKSVKLIKQVGKVIEEAQIIA